MVREWLGNQAAGGYTTYNAATGKYAVPPEQAVALADDESKFYLLGAYDILASFFTDEDRLGEAYGSAAGLHWSEHDHRLFAGTEAFFRARLPPAPGRSPRRDVRSRNPGIELETTEQADTQHRCVKA